VKNLIQFSCFSQTPHRVATYREYGDGWRATVSDHAKGKERAMNRQQTVAEMVEEVLYRQAATRAEDTGEPFTRALEAVLDTVAGRQLEELKNGPARYERAQTWQDGLAVERLEEQLRYFVKTETRRAPEALSSPSDTRYSWLQVYLETLHGKEVREEYYTRL
jgi:hypothetical protein